MKTLTDNEIIAKYSKLPEGIYNLNHTEVDGNCYVTRVRVFENVEIEHLCITTQQVVDSIPGIK
jgi:hypothetical protein